MTSANKTHSVIVPLVTPLTPAGELDQSAAERLVDHVAGNGCGMLVIGTTGEVASLTSQIRRRYVELAVQVNAGRSPVYACVGDNCFAASVAAAGDYLRAGANAVVGMLPNYFKLEPEEMERYFTRLSAEIARPLLLYNIPQTVGMSLPVDVVERLSRQKNIVGFKDSENTAGRRELVAARLGGRSDFALYMGVSAHSVAALRLGFAGLVPSTGNLVPALWRELCDAAHAGKWTQAEELQRKLDAINVVFQRGRTLGRSLAALKAGLTGRQLCTPEMMPPLQALDPAEQLAIQRELAEVV